MPDTSSDDPLATALAERDRRAMAQLPSALTALPTSFVLLQSHNLVGIEALRALGKSSEPNTETADGAISPPLTFPIPATLWMASNRTATGW